MPLHRSLHKVSGNVSDTCSSAILRACRFSARGKSSPLMKIGAGLLLFSSAFTLRLLLISCPPAQPQACPSGPKMLDSSDRDEEAPTMGALTNSTVNDIQFRFVNRTNIMINIM